METERREIKIDVEHEKTKLLAEARRLKEEYFADTENWVLPDDYVGSREESERRLEIKARNKFRKGWLSQVDACIFQNGVETFLPKDDADRQEMEAKMKEPLKILREEVKRVMMQDKKVVQEALCDDDVFKQFVSECKLSQGDMIMIYLNVSKNQLESAEDYLWSIETVIQKFEDNETKFKSWFKLQFDKWVKHYFSLERKYKSISLKAVEAGDKILDIVIEQLGKKEDEGLK